MWPHSALTSHNQCLNCAVGRRIPQNTTAHTGLRTRIPQCTPHIRDRIKSRIPLSGTVLTGAATAPGTDQNPAARYAHPPIIP